MKNTTLLLAFIIGASCLVGCGNPNSGTGAINADSTQTAPDSSFVEEGNDRSSADFELFAASFLNAAFWGMNIDSLMHAASPVTNQFVHKDFPFGRYWNMGVFCNIYHGGDLGYPFRDDYHGDVQPANKNTHFFKDKMPENGFCDASTSPDGLYYQAVTRFPQYQDPASEGDPNREVEVPAKFKNAPIMNLKILVDKYIIKDIYFIQIERVWYLTYFYDCDCSA